MSQEGKTKTRASRQAATTAPNTLRRDAVRLFNIVNDQNIPPEVRHALVGYVDDVASSAVSADWTNNSAHFLRWSTATARARLSRAVSEIIKRLHKGETAEETIRDFEHQWAVRAASRRRAELTKPEPQDRTSAEWRYWKLRRMEQAFQSGDKEGYRAAWDEFEALLMGLLRDENFWRAQSALTLLPHLMIARQEIDRTKHSPAAKKSARARTAKGGAR